MHQHLQTILLVMSLILIPGLSASAQQPYRHVESAVDHPSPPVVVGVPPVDAGRGLVRVSDNEIRHYAGKGSTHLLRSLDNGLTWDRVPVHKSFPAQVAGLPKEGCNIIPLKNGEWMRFQPVGGDLWRSFGGLDGEWKRLPSPEGGEGNKAFLSLSGNKRGGLWVNNRKRLLIPASQGRSWVWYSDDGGNTFKQSTIIQAPHHQIDAGRGGVHHGRRWNHNACEPTIVELKDGRLWMIVRTAQDQHWECFSKDFGEKWSEPKPSRFWATCTMPTITRLKDGRLLMLWSNTTPLPETLRTNPEFRKTRGEKVPGGEDVFTNRDAQHAAISDDEGKTWRGLREIITDEHRNDDDYAVTKGSNDRGKHQSQVVQLDDTRVLIALGQHPLHRKFVILDLGWVLIDSRESDLSKPEGLADWMHHTYVPQIRGHCGYNRQPGGRYDAELGGLVLGRPNRPERTEPDFKIDYTREGAVWNFPASAKGRLDVKLRLQPGGQGLVLSLHDRWFNPVDVTAERFAAFKLEIPGDGRLDDGAVLKPGKWHVLSLVWDGHTKGATAQVELNGQKTGIVLPLANATPNGLSYVHMVSAAKSFDDAGFVVGGASMKPTK